MNYKFYLRDKTKVETSIFLKSQIKGKLFKYSLGSDLLIEPKEWNFEKQRSKVKNSRINARIHNVITECERYFAQKERQGEEISFDELREVLNKLSDVKESSLKKSKNLEFEDYLTDFIKRMQTGEIQTPKGGRKYTQISIKAYKRLSTLMNEYKVFANRKHIKFSDFNKGFPKKYATFMNSRSYSTNYKGSMMKCLKRVLGEALKEGLTDNDSFRHYKKDSEEVDKIALTESEVQRLFEYEPENELEGLYRDVFLIQCYTALRLSDAKRIRPEHIKTDEATGIKFIELRTHKGKILVSIPLRHEVITILERYNYSIPKVLDQKLNYAIKEVAKKVGITEKEEVQETKGGLKTIKYVPRYERISSHTGRRTAATNMYRNGINPLEIIKITGHASITTLMKYLKIGHKEVGRVVASNPFFSPKVKLKAVK